MVFVKGKSGNPGGQWRPGQSGNPSGRPKSKPFKEALERALKALGEKDYDKGLDHIAAAMAAKAMSGDMAAAKEIADRIDGKVPTAIGGTDELPSIKGFAWLDPEQDSQQASTQDDDELTQH